MAANDKKAPVIVIKKITVAGGGHHGGSWKVAMADFMTAMMAFFLVMWLVNQSDEVKAAVAEYFSTPSVIEYNFANYGAELTLEKLFVDLMNEPLKALRQFFEPMQMNTNVLDFDSPSVMQAFIIDQLKDDIANLTVDGDRIEFDIPDYLLFATGSVEVTSRFVDIMGRVSIVTGGLRESNIMIESRLFTQALDESARPFAGQIAEERLDIVRRAIGASFEFPGNELTGDIRLSDRPGPFAEEALSGFIHIRIEPKRGEASAVREPSSQDFRVEPFEELNPRILERGFLSR